MKPPRLYDHVGNRPFHDLARKRASSGWVPEPRSTAPTHHAATGLRAKWMRVSVCGRTDIEPTFGDGTKENATGGNICGTLPQIKAESYLGSVPIWAMGHFSEKWDSGCPTVRIWRGTPGEKMGQNGTPVLHSE